MSQFHWPLPSRSATASVPAQWRRKDFPWRVIEDCIASNLLQGWGQVARKGFERVTTKTVAERAGKEAETPPWAGLLWGPGCRIGDFASNILDSTETIFCPGWSLNEKSAASSLL